MNVSTADAWNLGREAAGPSCVGGPAGSPCNTYSAERQVVAFEPDPDFDRGTRSTGIRSGDSEALDQGRSTSNFVSGRLHSLAPATRHALSSITFETVIQHLAEGLLPQLGDALPLRAATSCGPRRAKCSTPATVRRADGAWRRTSSPTREGDARPRAVRAPGAASSRRFTPAGADPDAVIDLRAVFQQAHRELDVDALPPALLPRKGVFGLIDYEKAFCPDPREEDIFDLRGVDRDAAAPSSCVPDGYVADVLPLDAHEELAGFLDGVLLEAR